MLHANVKVRRCAVACILAGMLGKSAESHVQVGAMRARVIEVFSMSAMAAGYYLQSFRRWN